MPVRNSTYRPTHNYNRNLGDYQALSHAMQVSQPPSICMARQG
jgi:hypothetical protein